MTSRLADNCEIASRIIKIISIYVIRSVRVHLLCGIFYVKSLLKRKLKYAKQVREVTN